MGELRLSSKACWLRVGLMEDQMVSPLHVHQVSAAALPSTMHHRPAMAASPEQLLLGLVEPVPPSHSVFIDLAPPQPPHGSSHQQDEQDLGYISRMLMEEDVVDRFFFSMYPADHPTLLQAQQPFAQILFTSGGAISSAAPGGMPASELPRPDQGRSASNTDAMASASLSGTGTAEPGGCLFPDEGGMGIGVLSSMAFFRGMEEANMFLPRASRQLAQGADEHMDRFDGTEVNTGRSSMPMAMPVQRPHLEEGATARGMPGRLIPNGYGVRSAETNGVRIAMERPNMAARRQSISGKAAHGWSRTRHVVVAADLETLLMRCAEAVATNDRRDAGDLLERIRWHSSPAGDATQRLAHYFAEGLEARLAGTGSRLHHSITMEECTSGAELQKGYHLYSSGFSYLRMSLLFSNKMICNAVLGRKKVHVMHYGGSLGMQWPDLLRYLADREGGPPEVRITAIFMPPAAGRHPDRRVDEAGRWVSNCASQLGVPLRFRAILAKPEAVHAEDLGVDPDEVLVVNCMFYFRTLTDSGALAGGLRPNPRDLALDAIAKMKPSVFVHAVVHGGSPDSAFFTTRFRRALHDFSAQFDTMEATMPRGSGTRLVVERDIFARRAMNVIACEGTDRVERPQSYLEWHDRSRRAGLRQLPLDPELVQTLRDQAKLHHAHFVVGEDRGWLLQGWKGRVFYALSAWTAHATT